MTKCILVIEDQPDNCTILRDQLIVASFIVLEAEDGEAGVATALTERPDLILMDIQMPHVDGYAATRRIRAAPGMAATPIIAVTSCALAGDEAKTRASGCDAYVAKPCSPRALLAEVRRLPEPG